MGQAVRGVLADPDWKKKCGLGVLISFVPYVGAVWVAGYGLHYQRDIAWRRSDRLPTWGDASSQMKTGLYALVAGLVYTLPLSMLIGLGVALTMVPVLLALDSSRQIWPMVVWAVLVTLISTVLGVLSAGILYPVYTSVGLYDSIEAGFRLKEIFARMKSSGSAYWTTLRRSVGLMLLSSFAMMVLVVLAMGGTGLLGYLLLPRDVFALVIAFGVYPAEFVGIALAMLVAVPLMLANYRLWAGYGRVAYSLDGVTSPTPVAEPESVT